MCRIHMFFVCNDTATTQIYTYGHTLSLPDALPIFAIPETDQPPAERLQIIGPPRVIGRGFEMLAVEFNAKPRLAAGEVDDIGADHKLAGEARAVAGQFAPKQAFCFRRAVAEGACVLGEDRKGTRLNPSQ